MAMDASWLFRPQATAGDRDAQPAADVHPSEFRAAAMVPGDTDIVEFARLHLETRRLAVAQDIISAQAIATPGPLRYRAEVDRLDGPRRRVHDLESSIADLPGAPRRRKWRRLAARIGRRARGDRPCQGKGGQASAIRRHERRMPAMPEHAIARRSRDWSRRCGSRGRC